MLNRLTSNHQKLLRINWKLARGGHLNLNLQIQREVWTIECFFLSLFASIHPSTFSPIHPSSKCLTTSFSLLAHCSVPIRHALAAGYQYLLSSPYLNCPGNLEKIRQAYSQGGIELYKRTWRHLLYRM